jgi:formylglycine-generating enzyme required for sulfatase activity
VEPGELLLVYDKLTRKKTWEDPGECTWYMRRLSVKRRSGPPAWIRTGDGKEMLYVPPGVFHYGADYHQVPTGAYYIDRYPVTLEEYQRFMARTKHRPPVFNHGDVERQAPGIPVFAVSWDDAVAYAQWAGKRLPTDAEWEKAARGLYGNLYPWGDEYEFGRCYCTDHGMPPGPPPERWNGQDRWNGASVGWAPVGAFSPGGDSPFGVADTVGNLGEWTASEDPHWPGRKIWKGGGQILGPEKNRCSWYRSEQPANRHAVGFRCVVDATAVQIRLAAEKAALGLGKEPKA